MSSKMRATITCLLAAATLAAQNPAARPQQPEPPSDCAADGTVVNSLTGQPLPHANVTPSSNDGSGTSTDATGKWTISNLTCGSVFFRAEKGGYIQNSYGSVPAFGGVVKRLILTSGSAAHSLKIELMPESVVTGKVRDDVGDPAAGAQVRAVISIMQNGRRTWVNSAAGNTDSTGTYRLGGLTAGRYFLCATSRQVRYPVGGGNPAIYGENCFPGPITGGAGSGLQIEGGQDMHADFTLSQVTGVHVRGTLAGMPQTPSPGPAAPVASVQMFRLEADAVIDRGAIRPQRARNGKFEFQNVTPGSYILRASLSVAAENLSANAFIDVGSADLDGVSLLFQPGAPVNGTLQIDDVALATAQPQNNAVRPTVNVNLNPVGVGSSPGRIQWDSEHNSFAFQEVQAGKYRINANSAGAGYFVKSIRLHDHEVLNRDFMVDGPTGPIEIVVSNATGALQGTVTDTDGNPADSTIILQCGELPVRLGRSQADGTFSMKIVPAGPCKAWAFDDAENVEYADEDWMRRYAGAGVEVTIVTGSAAQVSLVRRVVPK
jgi:hypothetical protein